MNKSTYPTGNRGPLLYNPFITHLRLWGASRINLSTIQISANIISEPPKIMEATKDTENRGICSFELPPKKPRTPSWKNSGTKMALSWNPDWKWLGISSWFFFIPINGEFLDLFQNFWSFQSLLFESFLLGKPWWNGSGLLATQWSHPV